MRHLILALFLTAGCAAPALAADHAPPPPPIDWSDITGGPVNPDLAVGEELC